MIAQHATRMTRTSAPESPSTRGMSSSVSHSKRMTASPRSSAERSRTTFESIGVSTPNELLDYANTNRTALILMFQRIHRLVSDYDASVYFSDMLQVIWRKSVTPDQFESIHGFRSWAIAIMTQYAQWANSKRTREKAMTFTDYSTDDDRSYILDNYAQASSTSTETSCPAWLKDAINEMTDLQYQSIMSVKVQGLSYDETSQELNTSVHSMRRMIFKARRKIIKHAPSHWEPLASA